MALKLIRPRTPAERRRPLPEAVRGDAERLVGVRHPNFIQVFSWLGSSDDPGLVLQYVPGRSLAEHLEREGPLDWSTAARHVADVAEALVAVHARGVIHREITPANILWDPENDEAFLTGLGVGARLVEPSDRDRPITGIAPEAFDGAIGPAVDVYGLAATLFTLITGEAAFAAATIAELRDRVNQGLPESDSRCVAMPVPLERIIRDGLNADPGLRPDLDEFVATLRGSLNRLLADSLAMTSGASAPRPATGLRVEDEPDASPAPALLRVIVSRRIGPNKFIPIAATHDWAKPAAARDAAKVPPEPDQVFLRIGGRVRIEVVSDRPGFITVFNIGPTGELGLLYPDDHQPGGTFVAPMLRANQTLQILELEMTQPAGRERLLAVWSRQPLPLRLDRLQSLAGKRMPASRSSIATRDLNRVRQSMERLPRADWKAVSVELDHEPSAPSSAVDAPL